MSYVYPLNYESRGRYTEVRINRNLLYLNAVNANSRTLKVMLRNIDNVSHEYTVVAVTGTGIFKAGGPIYTSEKITVNPGETKEVYLDLANKSETAPIANASYTRDALNVFVDGVTTPDVVVYPLWVLDVSQGWAAHVTFGKTAKYAIVGTSTYTEPQLGTSEVFQFFITDASDWEYVPTVADNGILIAICPFDKTAGVVDLRQFKDPGPYQITLNPVTTGYLKVGADMVVDYSRLGNILGTMFAWITALGADAVSVFLKNKFIQYLFLQKFNPILADYFGAQHIDIDAYVDPNDPTKVHIVLYTYYNVNDDPGIPLAIILAIIISVTIIVVSTEWMIVETDRAEVQKKQIDYMKQADENFYKLMTDPNIPDDVKRVLAGGYRPAAHSISQLTGVPICEGWAVGNSCISWKVFLAIAAGAGILLFLSMLRK